MAHARPSRLCEIRTASAGNAFLLVRITAPGTMLITLDLGRQPERSEALAILTKPSRSIHALIGDSHQLDTVERMQTLLDEPLDVVLIDSDHRYESMAADFEA